jgi:hypothetical protein
MCSGLRVKPNIVAHIKSAADARRWEQIAAARIGSPGHRVIGKAKKKKKKKLNQNPRRRRGGTEKTFWDRRTKPKATPTFRRL